MAICLVSELFS